MSSTLSRIAVGTAGHWWTVAPYLRDRLAPPEAPATVPWRAAVTDPELGEVALTGWLFQHPAAASIVTVVHGLGGCARSAYVRRFATQAARAHSVLMLNLRGSDRKGADIYHAGLTADLVAAQESPEVRRHDRRLVVGFSLGGHVSLRTVAERPDLADALATVCTPLDLEPGVSHLDHWRQAVYREPVLAALRDILRAVPSERRLGTNGVYPERIRRLREWDERVVAPRFGFRDAAAYYRATSAGSVLGEIRTPTLFLATPGDPMVPRALLEPSLRTASPMVEPRWVAGGHVGFPSPQRIGSAILQWFDRGTADASIQT